MRNCAFFEFYLAWQVDPHFTYADQKYDLDLATSFRYPFAVNNLMVQAFRGDMRRVIVSSTLILSAPSSRAHRVMYHVISTSSSMVTTDCEQGKSRLNHI